MFSRMHQIFKEDVSKEIRTKLLENARELIETNFSEYIPVLRARIELQVTDEFGYAWDIRKTAPRCYIVNVKGDIWCSTMESTFEMTNMNFPHISKIFLATRKKK